ncbi:phospholipase D-like domain-containing protein [Knoellia sp. S7-12]|uniref:phospholipase D-like domain-containing protein n=1 Tax=Knoellia sp. S7-12 TaxID=3126698 RepID=UPI00336610CE
MHYGQRLAYDLLREAGGDRFSMFDLENDAGTPIYVHAKVGIVDDEWMTIGSDNLNLRSWSHDSELTCAVLDPDGELHRRLRTPLWAEHLGLPEDDPRLNDIDDPTALWNERVGAPGSRSTRTSRRRSRPGRHGGRHRSTAAPSTPTDGRGGCAAPPTSRWTSRRRGR